MKTHLARAAACLMFLAPAPLLAEDGLPFDVVRTTGRSAMSDWERLRTDGITPVIIGTAQDLENLTYLYSSDAPEWIRSVEEILEASERLTFPQSLHAVRKTEWQDLRDWAVENDTDDLVAALGDSFPFEIPEELWGEWPGMPPSQSEPLSLRDYNGKHHDEMYIALLPTSQPWEAPAYLQFGGWNANPAPEQHVAALRRWTDDHGAVPVVITSDVIELRIAKRPASRDEAMALAMDQYHYASDIVEQGVGTLSNLGALLLYGDFWYFWWD